MLNPKILYISSANPLEGPGRGALNVVNALKNAGLTVDFMTLNPVANHPEIIFVQDPPTILDKIKRKILNIWGSFRSGVWPGKEAKQGYYFFYKKEKYPPVSTDKVLSKITEKYDLVWIYFWQGMLSFETVNALYEKLKCTFFFVCADYSVMSGGCHFTADCDRFKIGCGKCTAWNSNSINDFTHWNVIYRQNIYEKIKPVILCNTYMKKFFFDESFLLKNARVEVTPPVVDSNLFHPIEKIELKDKYSIPQDIEFVIGFGSQKVDDPRKGFTYFVDAIKLLYSKLTEQERKKVLLLSIGKNEERIKSMFPFKMMCLGYMPFDKLSEFYSLSDVFVCTSVNDAGPSMVGQAISCGTPVVGFEMGALLDWVLNKGTGYCAKLRDSNELSDLLLKLFRMQRGDRNALSEHCRSVALSYSMDNRVEYWMSLYDKYRKIS